MGEPNARRGGETIAYRVEIVHGDGRLAAALAGEAATLAEAERLAACELRRPDRWGAVRIVEVHTRVVRVLTED